MSERSSGGVPVRLIDLSPATWLMIDPASANEGLSRGNRVHNRIPPGFEAHAKVLHPFTGDMSKVPAESPLFRSLQAGAWHEIPEGHVLQKGSRGRWFDLTTARRIRWAEVTEYLGMKLAPQLAMSDFIRKGTHRRLVCRYAIPDESDLDRQLRDALLEVLHAWQDPGANCYMLWAPYVAIHTDWDCLDYVLCTGTLGQLAQWEAVDSHPPFPNYLWPSDRAWVLYVDLDAWYSLLGGSKDLVGRVASDPRIEALPVGEDQEICEP